MTFKKDDLKEKHSDAARTLSRRTFLKLSAGALTTLAGCRFVSSDPAPAYAPVPTAEPQPTSPPPATWTPTPSSPTPLTPTYTPVPATPADPPKPTAQPEPALSRAALMAHWPETATSRVVLVRHGGVWDGDVPNPAIVLQMLDAGLSTLAGVSDALAVWRALFSPGEKVLLKVNCISYGGPTQPAVTYAVAQRLQDAGLAAENILIFDRTDHELESAGYTVNDGGPGVQCRGKRGDGTEAALSQSTVRFYQEFDTCDAIINIPTPKQHGTAGISMAMKNHYGSVDRPGSLHGNRCDPAIAELNAQPTIRDKTRLVVGAALSVSSSDWNRPEREDALLLSFDPVALDTVARDILVRHRQEKGMGVNSLIEGAPQLNTAQALKLGATDAELIDLQEVILG
ncbi:MAG: DUF362 domain-containing protein [Anaerolineae bacterium]|nr:DUF362 domain-containing protein [Anaerolineae bacterium]